MSAHPESAIGRIAGNTERRDRTTTMAILTAAQNGTSGSTLGRITGWTGAEDDARPSSTLLL